MMRSWQRKAMIGLALALALTVVDAFLPSSRIGNPSPQINQKGFLFTSALASASSSSEEKPNESLSASKGQVTLTKSLVSVSEIIFIDILCRRLLQKLAISFPSSLAGCGVLFASMIIIPGGGRLFDVLNPGATLLAKWLPVFFVPSLVTLPLANGLESFYEFVKVAAVVVGGFYFTLLSTAGSVVGVRKVIPGRNETPEDANKESNELQAPAPGPAPKPFSDKVNAIIRAAAIVSGAGALLSNKIAALDGVKTPLTSLFFLATTLSTFVFGARLPKSFNKVVHPLVTCTTLTLSVAQVFAKLTGGSFKSVLRSYRAGTMSPMLAGAGDILLFMLGPAVISLACQMYDRRKLMKENLPEVVTAILVSACGGAFGTAAAVRALQIGSPYLRLSLLSRNITSPLAMAIAAIVGADVSLAVSVVVVTGLIGANFGASILDSFGVKDPVARGLGIGAAAHGLGTASFVNEKDAFPFAAISMALTASAVTVLVSIPIFKRALLQLALG